ncbi:uncharacterized protein BDR25DRAFT_235916, partial [Lindgomyces ingoldianus]
LIPLASGTTIRNHFNANCKGGHLTCRSIGPSTCCGGTLHVPVDGAPSALFVSLPKQVTVIGWHPKSSNSQCGDVAKKVATSSPNKCLGTKATAGGKHFTGTSWTTVEGIEGEAQKCTSTIEPDALVLDDGHMYKLQAMEVGDVNTLLEFAVNGTLAADLPGVYGKYEIEKEGLEGRLQEMQGEPEE